MSRGVFGIGYEGRTLEELIALLDAEGTTVVADVRLNAISRKRGFSKTALCTALEAHSIGYVHLPELGNPRDNRAGYAHVDSTDGRRARERFRAGLEAEGPQSAIRRLAAMARSERVAVLCFEQSDETCHRQQVIEAVAAAADGASEQAP